MMKKIFLIIIISSLAFTVIPQKKYTIVMRDGVLMALTDTTYIYQAIALKLDKTSFQDSLFNYDILFGSDTTSLSARIDNIIPIPDTTGITDGYVAKYLSGDVVWSPDIEGGTGGLDTADVNGLINLALAGQDSGYYVSKVEMFTGNSVPMVINSEDSGDVLIITTAAPIHRTWAGTTTIYLYGTTELITRVTDDETLDYPLTLSAYITVDDTGDVNFGFYNGDLEEWSQNQTATVITLKKGIVGGGSGDLSTTFYTGEDSIHYGQDSIVVTHGVGSTPQFVSIQLTSNSFGYPIWVNTTGSSTFAVKRSDVGLETINSSIRFKWMAYK